MTQRRHLLLLLSLLALIVTTALATPPAKPDLSGKWSLNLAKSEIGPAPPPKSRIDEITQKGDHIRLVRTQVDQSNKTYVLTLDCVLGGPDCASNYTDPQVKIGGKAKWEGDVLLFDLAVTATAGQATFQDHYARSADGKTLVIKRHLATMMGSLDQTLVMEKQ
jgi:hypothetical protein